MGALTPHYIKYRLYKLIFGYKSLRKFFAHYRNAWILHNLMNHQFYMSDKLSMYNADKVVDIWKNNKLKSSFYTFALMNIFFACYRASLNTNTLVPRRFVISKQPCAEGGTLWRVWVMVTGRAIEVAGLKKICFCCFAFVIVYLFVCVCVCVCGGGGVLMHDEQQCFII